MFFEGGDELPEYNDFVAYEGGDGEDDGLDKGDEDEAQKLSSPRARRKRRRRSLRLSKA